MFVVLLATVLAQTPAPGAEVAVIPVVREQSIQPELAEKLARSVEETLEASGYRTLPVEVAERKLGAQDPAACQNTLACFGLLGKTLGVPVLVRIEGTAVSTDLAVFIQAVRTSDNTVLAEHSTVTRTSASREQLDQDLAPFFQKLRTTSPPQPNAVTSTTPGSQPQASATTPDLSAGVTPGSRPGVTPGSTPDQAPAEAHAGVHPTHRPLWPLAPVAVGVASIVTGSVLLAQASGSYSDLTTKRSDGAQLTPDQARALANSGKTQQTFGWVALGVGAAAAGAGAVLYFTSSSGEGPQVSLAPTAGGVVAQGSF